MMDMLETYIPQNVSATLMTGLVVLVVLWLATFVVKKLIGVALAVALAFGGWVVWNDPSLLLTAQDSVLAYVDQWRYGSSDDEERRW
jgi:hypothetical protein